MGESSSKGKWENVSCPLCSGGNYHHYVMAPSHYGPEKLAVTGCGDCGMVFTNPQFTGYEQEVENRGAFTRHFDSKVISEAIRQAKLQLGLIGRFAKLGSVLDFGCGAGAFVKVASDNGWDAKGIDLNRGLIEKANEHWGFSRLQSCALEGLIAPNNQEFDAIICNQVFEHLQKPLQLGKVLVSLLRPGGVILIDVPNVNQLGEWMRKGKTLDPTAHWCHFSTKTLTRLVVELGCDPVYVSAAPSFVSIYERLGLGGLSFRLGILTKALLPGIGTGVCVIGRKSS